ncbi:MAG TPA: T9SS type A sorting domain-containing protein, partial [Prolixibacteraceae bacterium]|nr:T9SS type A sorting domain-containing protein [Prolixibacteraceae bacterium]
TYYDDVLPLLLEEHGGQAPYDFTYEGDVTKLIYSMSGAFSPAPDNWPPVDFPVDSLGQVIGEIARRWEPNNPIRLISQWKGDPKLAVYLYCGERDEYRLLPQNRLFSDTLNANGIDHTFTIDPNGDHILSLISSLPEGINFLFHAMDTATTNPSQAPALFSPTREVSLYPNPTHNVLHIHSNGDAAFVSAELRTLSGSRIRNYSLSGTKTSILCEDLPRGCYFLLVELNNRQSIRLKFMKD